MSAGALIPKPWLRWTLGFGFWTLIGLSFASQFYISSAKAGLSVTWSQAVGFALGDWYVFALLSLPVAWLGRTFSLEGRPWRRHATIHLLASICFSLLYILLRAGLATLQRGEDGTPVSYAQAFQPLLLKSWHFNFLVYWVMIAVTHAFAYYRKYQERELRTAELERRLAQARLHALQMQLNPHFLFNTLHAISSLMHRNVDAADRMIARLSELLRYALESTEAQEVPLSQELHFLRRYLEIEETRFGPRLRVQFDVDPASLAALVPNLILQPLVENAIRHGIEPHARPGHLLVRTRRQGPQLSLVVADNGGGLDPANLDEGVGLANTRARLHHLYGPHHTFSLNNAPSGGLEAALTIPFRLPDEVSAPASTQMA